MDTLVFDIETQNFFTDPGVGWNNFDALKISAVGVYFYATDRYQCFEEYEIPEVARLFRESRLLVGFSINRYDVPVLNAYFKKLAPSLRFNLYEKDRVDLLEEIEMRTGGRISLDRLSEANLGAGKTHHPSEAAALWRAGNMEELKAYCLKDVELTKRLYDLSRTQKYLWVPNPRTDEVMKAEFSSPDARTTPLF